MKKFERLVDELAHMIRLGHLRSGEKMPSVRAMSRQKQLSINTVLKAYECLERQGLLASKPQSGFYVLGRPNAHLVQVAAPHPMVPVDVKIPELVNLLIDTSKNTQMAQFGAAYLDPSLYPSEVLTRLTRQVLREFPDAIASYELSPGAFDYRRQIARQLNRVNCPVAPEHILATHGAAEAVSLALRAVCQPGDTVVAESPLFFGTLQAMEGLGLRVIEVRSDPQSGVDLDQLQRAIKRHRIAAGVFMPNFSNPLGSAMPDLKKQALVELMVHHQIPVIEDDIYAELPFQGDRPKPLKAFDPDGSVLTCSSFSKTVSPGLRIGWIAPGKYESHVRRLQLSTTMGAGALAQKIMATYLASRQYEKNLRALRLHCSIHVRKMAQQVLEHFPAGTRVSLPQGGFVLWVALPKKLDAVALYRAALPHGIAFSPGVLFSATGQYRHCLRLNGGVAWTEPVETALKTLGILAKAL